MRTNRNDTFHFSLFIDWFGNWFWSECVCNVKACIPRLWRPGPCFEFEYLLGAAFVVSGFWTEDSFLNDFFFKLGGDFSINFHDFVNKISEPWPLFDEKTILNFLAAPLYSSSAKSQYMLIMRAADGVSFFQSCDQIESKKAVLKVYAVYWLGLDSESFFSPVNTPRIVRQLQ